MIMLVGSVRPTRSVRAPKTPIVQPSKLAIEAARRIFAIAERAAGSWATFSGESCGAAMGGAGELGGSGVTTFVIVNGGGTVQYGVG